ncbi:Lrp/AsnC family transcriptional regulator [Daejeonella lutea]|uniref:Lrp/AsnC family transcriptional regulator, leucine-responsive regulatory protein n=1 Tax=Daejeonella lutea TaxID=572036 RepID=A0A1T5CZR2_9SPHI|nr:Lrp/AsnC family transcriptional regulator [Daejeonella lutea]SKB64889.1 Lrp/AsnC family transcriptional regulator, leucine-responsive regulatory protein [Daejeonella lutea]
MTNPKELHLDQTDLSILRLMQDNARISNADIARELEMAPSGVLERVKKLEQKEVILQYTTRLNPLALHQSLLAFVFIKSADGMGCNDTAKLLAEVPEVQEVHHVAGEDCYLVKIRTSDSASLMYLMRNSLSKIPNILSTRTTIVLETVKEQQQLVITK